jgi:hypothetical protein
VQRDFLLTIARQIDALDLHRPTAATSPRLVASQDDG